MSLSLCGVPQPCVSAGLPSSQALVWLPSMKHNQVPLGCPGIFSSKCRLSSRPCPEFTWCLLGKALRILVGKLACLEQCDVLHSLLMSSSMCCLLQASEDTPENVLEAREWIRAWRARSASCPHAGTGSVHDTRAHCLLAHHAKGYWGHLSCQTASRLQE